MVSRFLNRSLAFSASLALLAGVGIAGSGLEAVARTSGPTAEGSVLVETETDAGNVAGAAVDLADAELWLAELEGGNFANIFIIETDGSMRCGEIAVNAACKPLNEADKAAAIAEARESVGFATAAVEDAETTFAATQTAEGIENAAYTP